MKEEAAAQEKHGGLARPAAAEPVTSSAAAVVKVVFVSGWKEGINEKELTKSGAQDPAVRAGGRRICTAARIRLKAETRFFNFSSLFKFTFALFFYFSVDSFALNKQFDRRSVVNSLSLHLSIRLTDAVIVPAQRSKVHHGKCSFQSSKPAVPNLF